jgi:hypothetical protein
LANVARFLVPQSATAANLRVQFEERSQLFIRTHNETLSVVAMRISNSDRSSLRING